MRRVALSVNGTRHELELEPRELLVYVLRERLGLTGTNVGCDTSACGACTVLLDGEAVKSCTVLGVQADGTEITTIEGLARNGELHPCSRHSTSTMRCSAATAPREWCSRPCRCSSTARRPRGRDPHRPRGQPLPLHRLPQHRPRRRGRGREGVR